MKMANSMPTLLQQGVEMYQQQPDIKKMGFLTSLFKVTPESFTDVNKISMDMVYGGNDIAPVVRNLSTGAVIITIDKFGNMEVPFPVYSLETPVDITQLMDRFPGESAFVKGAAINWYGRMATKIKEGTNKHIRMIKGAMEYQAAQVLTTGKCTLTDKVIKKPDGISRTGEDTGPYQVPPPQLIDDELGVCHGDSGVPYGIPQGTGLQIKNTIPARNAVSIPDPRLTDSVLFEFFFGTDGGEIAAGFFVFECDIEIRPAGTSENREREAHNKPSSKGKRPGLCAGHVPL
jgi:hypothetical protein